MEVKKTRTTPNESELKVEQVFIKYPETRNCIHKLYWRYWQMHDNLGMCIDYDVFMSLTPAETISRAGRWRQNHPDPAVRNYEPTQKSRKARKRKQGAMHEKYKHEKITIFGGVKFVEAPNPW